jgi:hypothetical protein
VGIGLGLILVEEKNETKVFKKTSKKHLRNEKSLLCTAEKHLTSVNRSWKLKQIQLKTRRIRS